MVRLRAARLRRDELARVEGRVQGVIRLRATRLRRYESACLLRGYGVMGWW
ncbi:MAG: hypothetical protein NTZ08_09775 [Verrucomicrobia bacterium]|nr:hypothetical protein [Verrucomicrobiota bacterium]